MVLMGFGLFGFLAFLGGCFFGFIWEASKGAGGPVEPVSLQPAERTVRAVLCFCAVSF